MKTRVQELLRIGDQLYSKRFPLLTLWQTYAENFYPVRADFTRVRYISEEFASYLMTGRPILAHRELSNALSSILRPRGMIPERRYRVKLAKVHADAAPGGS